MTFFYFARYAFLLALLAAVVLFVWWSRDADAL
jgi:hypothetical protein